MYERLGLPARLIPDFVKKDAAVCWLRGGDNTRGGQRALNFVDGLGASGAAQLGQLPRLIDERRERCGARLHLFAYLALVRRENGPGAATEPGVTLHGGDERRSLRQLRQRGDGGRPFLLPALGRALQRHAR